MEAKTKRPDVHLEPTLYGVMKAYCTKKQTPMAKWVRGLIVRELRQEGVLTADHLKIMRGI